MRTRAPFFVFLLNLGLGLSCVGPAVMQEKTRVFETELLSSFQDGRTTRQDVLLRFGTPSASFEGGRILTFDFVVNISGEWQRVGNAVVSEWLYPLPSTSSLVLVFGPDDRLLRHRLVTAPGMTTPPLTEPASAPTK